jgi:beta-glucosidase
MPTPILSGFEKVFIEPGASAQVTLNLRWKDAASWDTVQQAWIIPEGNCKVFVGKSVLDTQLTGSFTT